MAGITSFFLRKGFLIEPNLQKVLEKVDSSIAEEFVDVTTRLIKEKIISEKNFISNIKEINSTLSRKAEENPEKKEALEKAISLFSSLLPKQEANLRSNEIAVNQNVINPPQIQKIPDLQAEIKDENPLTVKMTENQPEITAKLKIAEIPRILEAAKKLPEVSIEELEGRQLKQDGEGYSTKSYLIPIKKFCVDDFAEHFKNRYTILKDMLKNHFELDNLTSISKINEEKQRISIIGMVFSKRKTKNKNLIFKVEDLTGQISVVVSHNREDLFEKAENIVEDDVVGFKCVGNSEILFAEDIILQEIQARKKNLEKEDYAVFISDIHIGSNNFLEKQFSNFIKWLNLETGSDSQKKIAEKVKYLFIAGDTVDGVGVFPAQEKLLVISDLKDQYNKLAEFLNKIRRDITVFLCPGQHDATRLAEPQPPISPEYASSLYKIKSLIMLSNPSWITLGKSGNFPGIKILMYHGASFHNIINELDELRTSGAHDNPTKIVKILLEKRHLAPSHSFTTYLPCSEDPLLIKETPDIVVTGDLHRAEVSNYKNILLIASSCWQSVTPFEEKVGNHPDPCKVPVLNLKTNEVKIMDFS